MGEGVTQLTGFAFLMSDWVAEMALFLRDWDRLEWFRVRVANRGSASPHDYVVIDPP